MKTTKVVAMIVAVLLSTLILPAFERGGYTGVTEWLDQALGNPVCSCDCTEVVTDALTAVGHAPVPQQVFGYLPPGKTGSVREFAGLQKGDDGIPAISGMWESNKTTLRIPQPTGWTVDRFVSEANYALQKYKGKSFEVERGVDQAITFYEAQIDKKKVIATFAPFVTTP